MAAHPAGAGRGRELTETDIAVLEFERFWLQRPTGKDEAIRSELGLSPAGYYQLLRELITQRSALEFDPMLIKRLVRIREERMRTRSVRLQHDVSATSANTEHPEVKDLS